MHIFLRCSIPSFFSLCIYDNKICRNTSYITSHCLKNSLRTYVGIFAVYKIKSVPEENVPWLLEASREETINIFRSAVSDFFWEKQKITEETNGEEKKTDITKMEEKEKISRYLLAISHLLRSGDLSAVSSELPLCRNPRFELFWGLCQEPFFLAASLPLLACSRLLSRFAMFCSMSINICCSSSIISEAAYELQLPSGGLYRISKQTTAYAY